MPFRNMVGWDSVCVLVQLFLRKFTVVAAMRVLVMHRCTP